MDNDAAAAMPTLEASLKKLTNWLAGLPSPPPTYTKILLIDRKRLSQLESKRGAMDGLLKKPWKLDRSEWSSPDLFEPLFDEIAKKGYEWVHFKPVGVVADSLLVTLDYPQDSKGIPAKLMAINVAGPPGDNWTPPWSLTS